MNIPLLVPIQILSEVLCTYKNLQKVHHVKNKTEQNDLFIGQKIQALQVYLDTNISSMTDDEKNIAISGLRILLVIRSKKIDEGMLELERVFNEFQSERWRTNL